MIIASNIQLYAVSYDTATYCDLKHFIGEHQGYVLERIDPEKFLSSPLALGSYINLVIRDVNLRKQVTQYLDQHNADRFSLIHDRACVSDYSSIAPGCMIYPMVVVYPSARINQDVIVHSLTTIAHQCCVGTGSFISSGTSIAGSTSIGEFTQIGINVSVHDRISIPDNTVIGAASVVRKNILKSGTYSNQLRNKLIKLK